MDVNVFCIALHRDERLGPMLQWALVRVKKIVRTWQGFRMSF